MAKEKSIWFEKNLKVSVGRISVYKAIEKLVVLHQLFNDVILTVMLLHQ